MFRVSFHVSCRPPDYSGSKNKPFQMQMEYGGIGFVCANYCSTIVHLETKYIYIKDSLAKQNYLKFHLPCEFFFKTNSVRFNNIASRLLLFSIICDGFLALNLSIHLNLIQCYYCFSLHIVCVRSSVCICTLTCVRIMLEMAPKQRQVVFIPISKQEREMNIEREFAALSERLQKEQSRSKNETFKRLVGRPRRDKRCC